MCKYVGGFSKYDIQKRGHIQIMRPDESCLKDFSPTILQKLNKKINNKNYIN